ncbi:MAG: C4-dicarboxylate transporter DcuC [Sutterellaceae bacterium]|nr:C4-dicarboxylate transporter DcuC [Sutterellaceae bacterium]
MTSLLPWIAVVVTVIAGWALVKRYQTHMVLLFAGLAILVCVALAGGDFLPKGVKPSGFWLFDIFSTLKTIATKQSSGIGFLIMTAGGFAAYMDRIGAAKALVDVAVKPLSALKAPYIVLMGGYIVGQLLVIVIPSAAGLAMLLLVALFPILKAVGVSAAAAAAVIGTSAGMTFAPTAGTASLAAKVAGLDPIIYLVQYQLPLAIPTLIVAALAHYFVQRYYDKKGDDIYAEAAEIKKTDVPEVPKWYAIFPVLPIALLIIFSKLVVSSVKLDTIAALFMVWVGVVIIEIIRLRDVKKIFKDAMAMFQSMGKMFAGIVALIICAEFFGTGLKTSGLIDALINSAQGVGAGMGTMTVILTGIVSAVTFLTGSGVGAYSSFATLAPDVAAGLGGSVEALVTPMQFASGMLRAMSPVAGVIIAVAGAAGISPVAIVRRTWIPMALGMVTTLVFNMILFG